VHIELKIPKSILKVIKKLQKKGYTTYLVGGCVRDLLMGLTPKDYDIGTTATPEEILKIFPARSQIIGRRFPIVHVYLGKNGYVEVTTFRGKEELDSKKKDNYGTPEEDAFRRDLTINALFYDIKKQEIIDYVGGLEDLKKGIVRVIGEPSKRFEQDPVRMLRAVRHSVRLGFTIEKKSWEAILKCKHLIKKVPWERLRDEILKDLSGFWVYRWFLALKETGLLYEIYPFYRELEKNPSFDESFLFKILRYLEKNEKMDLEIKVVLFAFAFLPLIERPYNPISFKKTPGFERQDLLKLFWALFFTFRFHRALFEKSMDMLRDSYKILYLIKNKHPISKKYKKKPYFDEVFRIVRFLEKIINKERKNVKKNRSL